MSKKKIDEITKDLIQVFKKHQIAFSLDTEPVNGKYDVTIKTNFLGLDSDEIKELFDTLERER